MRVNGRFTLPPSTSGLDLAQARVKIVSLLAESGEAGELVDRVGAGPVDLVARAGGRTTSAIFESQPGSARPSFRMEVKQRSDATADFSLTVDRAVLSHDPLGCAAGPSSTTNLTTRFAIDDGRHPPVEVEAVRAWRCGPGGARAARRIPEASCGSGRAGAAPLYRGVEKLAEELSLGAPGESAHSRVTSVAERGGAR